MAAAEESTGCIIKLRLETSDGEWVLDLLKDAIDAAAPAEAAAQAEAAAPAPAARLHLDDSISIESSASTPVDVQWVLVFGGGEEERKELCSLLAAGTSGTYVDLATLLEFAKADDSDEARTVIETESSGGLLSAKQLAPLIRRVRGVQPAPLFLNSVFRMPTQLGAFEECLGGLAAAVQAPGTPPTGAAGKTSDSMAKAVGSRLHVAPSVDTTAVSAAVAAIVAAGVAASLQSPDLAEKEKALQHLAQRLDHVYNDDADALCAYLRDAGVIEQLCAALEHAGPIAQAAMFIVANVASEARDSTD